MRTPAVIKIGEAIAAITDSDLRLAALRTTTDPVARGAAFRAIKARRNTLTADESDLYRLTVVELYGDRERQTTWIGRLVGARRQRIVEILSAARAVEVAQ